MRGARGMPPCFACVMCWRMYISARVENIPRPAETLAMEVRTHTNTQLVADLLHRLFAQQNCDLSCLGGELQVDW